jgi:hypothetical protein
VFRERRAKLALRSRLSWNRQPGKLCGMSRRGFRGLAGLFSQVPYDRSVGRRHRFRLFDELFTQPLRGHGVVPRDEITDVA